MRLTSRQPWRLLPSDIAAAGLIGLLLVGCGVDAANKQPVLALADSFHEMDAIRELPAFDFGDPAARGLLGHGWSYIQRDQQREEHYVWAIGDSSVLTFPVLAQRDLRILLRCLPFYEPGSPDPWLTVHLNGREIDSFVLRKSLSEYEVLLPGDIVQLGENRLGFGYSYQHDRSQDSRPLAVAWYGLVFPEALGLETDARGRVMARDLVLPHHRAVRVFVNVPEKAELRLRALHFQGGTGSRLTILEQRDESPESLLATFAPDDTPRPIRLAPGVTRLTLLAQTKDRTEGGGLRIEHPAVWAPPTKHKTEGRLPSRRHSRANLLIYLIDTLRTDAIGAYGYPRGTTPEIDKFASQADLFENAIGQSTWTRSSVASLFTGLWPVRHGTLDRKDKLPDEALTLAELLRDNGYQSAAFVTNPNVAWNFGMAQGFDEYKGLWGNPLSDVVNYHAFDWLRRRDPNRPFFLYLHTLDPHDPYLPTEEFAKRYAPGVPVQLGRQPRGRGSWPATPELVRQLRDLYDAEVALNDRSFGALLNFLAEEGLTNETVVVLLSDHGEEFQEHGSWTHGKNLHVEGLDFPLMIRYPGQSAGRRFKETAQHVDIAPTLLDYFGIAAPTDLDGRSLIALEDGSVAQRLTRVFAHLSLDGTHSVAVVEADWKLIVRRTPRGSHTYRLFDLAADPGETNNLAQSRPIMVNYLDRLIRTKIESGESRLESNEAELDTELERNLKALGYLQ